MKSNISPDSDLIWGGFMGEALGINVADYNKNSMTGCLVAVINGQKSHQGVLCGHSQRKLYGRILVR